MSDLIDRRAAIDELERGKDKKAKGTVGGFYNQIIDNDIEKLRRLPSAKPDVPDTNVGDTISRKAALDALGERPMLWVDDDNYTLGARNQYDSNRLAIETVPSVDAVPVVHGRWVADPEDDGVYSCSECGRYEFYESAFCPNCGADMRKDGNDHEAD